MFERGLTIASSTPHVHSHSFSYVHKSIHPSIPIATHTHCGAYFVYRRCARWQVHRFIAFTSKAPRAALVLSLHDAVHDRALDEAATPSAVTERVRPSAVAEASSPIDRLPAGRVAFTWDSERQKNPTQSARRFSRLAPYINHVTNPCARTHARTHARTRARAHVRTHSRNATQRNAHARTHGRTGAWAHACVHACTHGRMYVWQLARSVMVRSVLVFEPGSHFVVRVFESLQRQGLCERLVILAPDEVRQNNAS